MAHLTGIAYGGVDAPMSGPTDRRRRRPMPPDRRRVAQGRRARRAARRSGQDRPRRPPQPRAHPRRRSLRRARQPLPAPGRTARRGLDREGLAALPVARLRLRPAHRHAAARASPTRPACFPVEVRDDGVYVALAARAAARAHRLRRHGRDDGRRGASPTCSAWSATPTSASPTRCARRGGAATSRSSASATRARPRSRRRPTASSPAGRRRASRIAGPGLDQPADRPLRRQGRPGAGARDLGPGAVEGARPRRVPGPRPHRRVRRRRRLLARRCCPTPTTPS